MTDTVYLHRHGPDLARAAALVEDHLRSLLGIIPQGSGLAAAAGRTGLSQLRINGQDVTDGTNVRTRHVITCTCLNFSNRDLSGLKNR
jgi:hypothetical protein